MPIAIFIHFIIYKNDLSLTHILRTSFLICHVYLLLQATNLYTQNLLLLKFIHYIIINNIK